MTGPDLTEFDPEISEFWQYWNGLPKLELIPKLSDYLDHAPPKLQPSVALVDVYGPDRFSLRMAGTAIVEAIGGEPHETGPVAAYSLEARKAAALMAWQSVSRPCGYTSKRLVRTRSGRMLLVHGIALPLLTDRKDSKMLVNFGNLSRSVSDMRSLDKMETMQALHLNTWVDIGAGVPDKP